MAESIKVKPEQMTEAYIKKDRMRYVKNKMSANLAILSIILNGLFFISIYKSNVGQYYYKPLIGLSIVYNLLFMMIVFLVSEGSKNYQINYSYIAIPVAVMQFVRIFIYPVTAHNATTLTTGIEEQVMRDAQFTRLVIYLIGSGVCLLISSFVGIVRCNTLKKHIAEVEG
ncbi:MAG: hypothetical protein IJ796_05460 [Lachnospiraceae bacterium]|nr:hypothetical protein [Lachnospiraceae bacterium]